MTEKKITRKAQVYLMVIVMSLILMWAFEESVVENASAGSSWIQTSEADFNAGDPKDVTITASGEVKLAEQEKFIIDEFTSHSKVSDKKNVTLEISPGDFVINRTYGGTGGDYVRSVQQTSDGGYIMVGQTGSFGGASYEVWLIKAKYNGNEQWNKTYGGSDGDYGYSVAETSDSGFIIVGYTFSYGAGGADAYLIKTDNYGTELWNKTFGGGSGDYGYSVAETSDGGFIIAGSTYSFGAGDMDLWLIKTNSSGDEEWNNTFGTWDEEEGSWAIETSDGGFIMLGSTPFYGAGSSDVWFIKTNSTGDEQWNKTFGGPWSDFGRIVRQTSDTGFIIVGRTYSFGAGSYDVWLIKTDINGNEKWNRTYGGSSYDIGYSAQETSDGGFFIAGATQSFGVIGNDLWAIKTENNGKEIWNTTFGGSNHEYGYSGQQTSDGGFIMAGYTNSYGAGNYDAWLVKMDASIGAAKLAKIFKTFGGALNDYGRSVLEAWDGGYIIAGNTFSFATGSDDGWLIKTDKNGNEEWNKTYGGSGSDGFYSANLTDDGGYILTGYTFSWGAGDADVWLVKTDRDGNEEWNKTFGGGGRDYGTSVKQTSDLGYIIVGLTTTWGAGGYDALVIKTIGNGNEQWNKTFGGASSDGGNSVVAASDNGFIIAGSTASFGAGGDDVWLIKVDLFGVEMWNYTYGGGSNDRGYSVSGVSDGGYVITGETWSYGAGNYDVWLLRVDFAGAIRLNKTFGGVDTDAGHSALETSDGGFLIFGETWSFAVGGYDLWLIKTDSLGGITLNRTYGGSTNEQGYSVKETSDGNYVITGYTRSYGAGLADVILIKADPLGRILYTYGELTSTNLLVGQGSSSIDGFECVVYIPFGTFMNAQFSKDGLNWYDSSGLLNQWNALSSGNNFINLSSLNWNGSVFYYRVDFQSDFGFAPSLQMINFTFKQYLTFGRLISQPFDSGGPVSWDLIDYNAIVPPGTDLRFQLRSATTQAGLWINTFVGPGGNPTNYYTGPGSIIWSGHDNERWIQFVAFFETTNGGITPVLEDFTIYYNRIPAPPQLSAPNDGDTINDSTPKFEWIFIDVDGIQTSYQVLIDDDINFGSVDFDSGTPNKSDEFWQFPDGTGYTEVPDGIWHWKVRTRDDDGDWGPYSNVWSFLLDTTILPPENISAIPDTWTNINSFTVSWTNPSDLMGIGGAYFKLDSPPTFDTDGTYVPGQGIDSIGGITVIGDGAHTVYVWLEDNVTNIDYNNTNSTILYFDGSAPSPPSGVTATPSSWTSTNSFTVTWTNPSEVSGIDGAYYKLDSPPTSNTDGTYVSGSDIDTIGGISVIGEGQHPIYIWLVDNVSNIDYTNNASTFFYYDASPPPPTIGLTAIPSSWTSTNSFTVTWTNPSDVSGIGGAYYKLDSPPTSNTDGTLISGPGIDSISSISVSGDGAHSIYVWLVDNASNVEYTKNSTTTLYFDGSPPASPIGVTADPDTWTSTNSFNVSWDNPPEMSGIAGAYYKLYSAPTSDTDGTYVPGPGITTISGISVSGDDQHIIYVWLQDNASNTLYTTSSSTYLYFDGTAPSLPEGISATPITWTSTNSFTVTWTNPSDLSGIGGAYYKLDSPPTSDTDGTYVAGSGITSINNIVVSGDGAHDVYIWLADEVGNIDYNNYNTTILYYDGSAPSSPTDVTADPDTWTSNNSFNITWTNPGDLTGIAGAYYKLDSPPTSGTDGTYVAGSEITNLSDISVSGDGAHTIYIWLVDEVGNIDYNNYNTTILYYDGPASSPPMDVIADPGTWTSINSFDVSWTNPFEPSGIIGAYYKLDSEPTSNTDGTYEAGADIDFIGGIIVSGDGAHTIYIWLENGAGFLDYNNTNTTILYFDSTPPSSPTGVAADPNIWTSTNSFTVNWTNPIDLSGIGGAYYKLDSPPTSNTDGTLVTGPGIDSISGITVTGAGAHTIYVWLQDNATNIDYTTNATTLFYYDNVAPSSPLDVTADPISWTGTNSFTVSWVNPMDLSGIGGVYYKLDSPPTSDTDGTLVTGPGIDSISSIVVPGDGVNTIYIWLMDNASNIDYNSYNTTTLYFDSSAPSSPTTVTPDPNTWTATNLFTVTWTNPSELSGIAGAYYKLDSAPTSDTDGTFVTGSGITSISNIVVSGDGQHQVYIWLIDEVGNIDYNNYNITTLFYDSTPPTSPTGVTADPSTWTGTNSFTASWSNPSDLSGIGGAYYKLDSEPNSNTDGTYVSGPGITSISSIVVSGDGQHTIYIWLEDNVNNIDYTTNATTIFNYDGSAPSSPTGIAANPSSWTGTNSFTVSWTNPSELSGIGGAYYKLDSAPTSDTDGTFVSGSGITSISNIIVSGDGQHPVYVWLIDEVGNIDYNNHNSAILYYDSSAPPAPTGISVSPNTWTSTNSFSVDWTEPSDDSGVKTGAYYYIGSSPPTFQAQGSWSSDKPLTITSAPEGSSNIYLWLEDNVGNKDYLNYGSIILKLDSTPPTIQHTLVTAGTINQPITITADVTDANAGVNNVLLFYKKKSDTLYTSQIMTDNGDTFSGEITADTTETREYYIKATDNSVAPNIAYYGLYGQGTVEPDSSNDIDITISGSDVIPPSIGSNSPTDGSSNVARDITISLAFSEPMNKTSVQNAFSITPSVTGNFSWDGNTLTFKPDGDLDSQTPYTVRVSTAAKDLAGNPLGSEFNIQFTTAADPSQPTVISKGPEGTGVSIGTTITVTFSEAMDTTSVQNAFSLSNGVSEVTGTFVWNGNELIFTPDSLLTLGTSYTVTIGSEAKDLENNNIQELSWQFTTKSSEVVTLPYVVVFSPKGSDITVDSEISIQFSVAMDKSATEDAFSIEPYVEVIPDWSGHTLKFIPTHKLNYSTVYKVKIDTSIAKSTEGRYLEEEEVEWSFITEVAPKKESTSFFSWDNLEPIVTGITILATFLIALFGFLQLRKKRSKLSQYLEKIDDTFNEYNKNYQVCEQEMITLREDIKKEVKEGKLEEAHFLILDKKIDDYLNEMKTLKKNGMMETKDQASLEKFGEEPIEGIEGKDEGELTGAEEEILEGEEPEKELDE